MVSRGGSKHDVENHIHSSLARVWHFGAIGLITIGVAVLIEMFSLVTGSTRGEITSGTVAEENVTSTQAAIEGQRVSLARFGDDMVGAGMI